MKFDKDTRVKVGMESGKECNVYVDVDGERVGVVLPGWVGGVLPGWVGGVLLG